MKSFKTYITEKKDHLIDKLAITDHQKKELKDFFAKKPNLENKIDWQKKGLAFKDFADVMATTKTERTRMVKKQGIAGLKDGKDYLELKVPADFPFQAYIPLTWEASKLIASNKIGKGTAKWCTAHHSLYKHWYEYAENFRVLIYLIGKDTKIAMVLDGNYIDDVYDIEDNITTVKPEYHTLVDINKSLINKARGIIEKGLKDRVWDGGTWLGGTWTGRLWKGGNWKDGNWKDGTWEAGSWDHGTWEGGIWEGGLWRNGTWEKGIWQNGIWKDGNWKGGTWKNGVWEGGTWQYGLWRNGIWKGGDWWDGTWWNGTWEAGTWQGGTWQAGTWQGGTWEAGLWERGDWLGGTWKGGDWWGGYDINGNYHEMGDSPDKWKLK